MKPDFDSMNEMDVREIIVRPLLGRLGYAHGTQANIRTEVTLRYDRAFLGRKSPSRDPVLAGRADYICDAVSYGRWAVEVKSPQHALTQDDVEQAHTYCTHPEIAAAYFMLTNGREFRLYATGRLENPIIGWPYEETDNQLMTLFNIIGYAAIRKLTEMTHPDVNKPLGPGLPSRLRVTGGEITYGNHHSDHPLFQKGGGAMKGLKAGVTGVVVERTDDGRLHARVTVRSPFQWLAELNRAAGAELFDFYCASEYVSNELEKPSIFQNVIDGRLEPGAEATIMPGMPPLKMPFGFSHNVITEATGYVEGDKFVGILAFEYNYQLIPGNPAVNPQLYQIVANSPSHAKLVGDGTFEVIFTNG
jgi:hypothetical protein